MRRQSEKRYEAGLLLSAIYSKFFHSNQKNPIAVFVKSIIRKAVHGTINFHGKKLLRTEMESVTGLRFENRTFMDPEPGAVLMEF